MFCLVSFTFIKSPRYAVDDIFSASTTEISSDEHSSAIDSGDEKRNALSSAGK